MEMVTLHELSVLFDVSVRVLRSRVRQLVQAGKLIEGRDCRREDFVDENHFVWKISPAAFTRETGLQPVAQPSTTVNQSGNQPPVRSTNPLPKVGETLIKPDTQSPGMEREMIDILKDQIVVKDRQIADLTVQNKTVVALNEKLTGAVVHQSEQIQNLLRLTGGKTLADAMVTEPVNQRTTPVNESVAQVEPDGANKAA